MLKESLRGRHVCLATLTDVRGMLQLPVAHSDHVLRRPYALKSALLFNPVNSEGLQAMGFSDMQILTELPRFLCGEPSRWFHVLKSHLNSWDQFSELFQKAFLPSDNQERIWKGILDRFQAHDEPLPTFVAHMLSEFKKLRCPPAEPDQVELVCKHAQEKYTIALYGTRISSVADLLLRAHELHAALGHRDLSSPAVVPTKSAKAVVCFKCSLPGYTSRTCPQCNPSPSQGDSAGKEWVTEFSSPHQGRSDTRVADREQFRKKGQTSRYAKGGGQYRHGGQHSSRDADVPTNRVTTEAEVHHLGHIVDTSSNASWNTPFCVSVKLKNLVVSATLDTGASLSAVLADYVDKDIAGNVKCEPWTAPPLKLADSAYCDPVGVTWLPIWFQGQRFFHRFVVLTTMSSSLILGMDFMIRASISIHVPTRTVTLGAQSVPFNLENEDSASATDLCSLEGPEIPHSQPNDSSVDLDGSALDPIQKDKLGSLLEDFRGLFAAHLGHTTVAVQHIDTGDARPINLPPYCTSPLKKKLIEEQIQSMLEDGIIEPASGPWSAPVVIVPKPSGEARFCVDYRGLNQVTVKDRYPLPRVDESLDFLARGKFISTLDMARGYWQVGVEKGSRAKTAFVSHCGLFQFRVLPFGLCNAPATFQRVMNTVLAGLIYKCCAVYLDDIVIASPTFEQHLLDLREVFLRLEKAGLTLKPGKCQFCRKELKFLGYKVSPDGILPDSDKIDAVLKFPVPTDVKQVRQFLGLTSYYRRFIHNYAQFAEPLFALTRHDTPFMWDRECQEAMDYLKTRLTSAPILNFPDFDRPFSLHTDACDMGLGAALMQRDEVGREVAIAYASRTLHRSERPYSTTEKECLGVIWALEHFRPYIEGLPVTVYTDHSSLTWLMSRPNPSGRLARWCLRLQDFDVRFVHKPGLKNTVPDALSRNPQQGSIGPTDVLPRYAIIASLGLASQSLAELVDKEQLRGLQREDPVVAEILRKQEDPQGTHSVEEWEDKFVTCDGLVYYRDTERSCSLHPLSDLKLFVPESLRGLLLKYYHDHPTAGHLGFTKSLARLKMRFFWPKMRKDVKSYVLSCPVCQLTKPSQLKPAGMLVPVHATEPWEIVGVDFVGPLPRTQAGNAYLLVFVDYFSKWVEVSAVREATAQIAASRFQSDIFARHGAPRFLISDRGQQFMSAFFNHVVEALGTEHRFTTAYHPQTNAAERVNRTLKAAIRAYVGDKHNTWDKYLPQICFALRTTPHESTGVSPAKMLYGRELSTPLDLLTKPSTDGLDDPLVSQPETPENTVQRIHDHARASLKSSHVRQKRHYDKTRRTVVYEPGDLVRLKSHPRSDAVANLTAKLAPVFSGPYKVVKKLSDVNYRLSGVDGTDMGVVHVVNLQPFRVRSTPHTESQSYLTSGTAASQDSSSSRVVDSLSPTSCEKPEFEIGEQAAVEGTHVSDRPVYSNSGQITLSQPLADMFVEERDTPLTHSYDLRSRVGCSDRLDTHTNLRLGHDIDNATDDLSQLEHPHTVPADGAVGVEVEGQQAFWTCDNKPFILVLTTVPPHTDSLGVSTKTKAGLVTEDDPLPF
ncbi:hypothetical protein NFI96_003241 [Prochilodus magdalenae]|nr:hypothetical protein NFI96_003241 [Prochilodus magdalenae]